MGQGRSTTVDALTFPKETATAMAISPTPSAYAVATVMAMKMRMEYVITQKFLDAHMSLPRIITTWPIGTMALAALCQVALRNPAPLILMEMEALEPPTFWNSWSFTEILASSRTRQSYRLKHVLSCLNDNLLGRP